MKCYSIDSAARVGVIAMVLLSLTLARSVAAQQVNLTGDWISAYSCPSTGERLPLPVRVIHNDGFIVGIKLAGDTCLQQENVVVFQGELFAFSNSMQCATYRGRPLVLRYVTDSIRVQNNNAFTACQASFTRVGQQFSQPQYQQPQPQPQPTGPTSCSRNEWYSSLYNRCFAKRGSCSQYNYTDSKTCNTRSDKLVCDWKATDNTCYAE